MVLVVPVGADLAGRAVLAGVGTDEPKTESESLFFCTVDNDLSCSSAGSGGELRLGSLRKIRSLLRRRHSSSRKGTLLSLCGITQRGDLVK